MIPSPARSARTTARLAALHRAVAPPDHDLTAEVERDLPRDAQRLMIAAAALWLLGSLVIDALLIDGAGSSWRVVALRGLGLAAIGGGLLALRHPATSLRGAWATVVAVGATLCALAAAIASDVAPAAAGSPYDLTPVVLLILTGWVLTPDWRGAAVAAVTWAAAYVVTRALVPGLVEVDASAADLGAAAVAHATLLVVAIAVTQRAHRLRHELSASRQLGNYRLLSPLGGGMSEVWLAWDEVRRREVALKLLPIAGATPATRARFAREVELVRSLSSPHLTRILDVGVADDGIAFIAFEYLRGLDLDALVAAAGPLPPGRAVHLVAQACRGLAAAHAAGVIHRDIKPANLHCSDARDDEDHVRVLDFGVARALDEAGVTQDGTAVGTPAYMSPEAFEGQRVSAASDVYALGATLYFALTGTPPFDGDSADELRRTHQLAPVVPPSLRAQVEVARALEKIVLRCLAKSPVRRYPDAAALGAALEDCARVLPPWRQEDAADWWRRARLGGGRSPTAARERTTEVEAIAPRSAD